MNTVQVLAPALLLCELELRDHNPIPGGTGSHQRRLHELQHAALIESVQNQLGAPTLLAKEVLKQVGRARHTPVRDRQLKMRDAALEVLHEAGRRARVLTLVAGDEVLFGDSGKLRAAGLVSGKRCA